MTSTALKKQLRFSGNYFHWYLFVVFFFQIKIYYQIMSFSKRKDKQLVF